MREIDDDTFLHEACWPGGVRACPRCSAESPYALSSGRYRCAVCQYTFSDLTGRWLARSLLTPLQWIRVVRAFVAGAPAAAIAEQVRAAPNTVRRAMRVIGQAICSSAPDAGAIAAVAPALVGDDGGGAAGAYVIGVHDRRCRVVTDIGADGLSSGPLARWGDLLYSAPRDGFDALVTSATRMTGFGSIPVMRRTEMPVDLHSALWRLAKERAGRPPRQMAQVLQLLKECEFLLMDGAADRRLLALLCSAAPRASRSGVKC